MTRLLMGLTGGLYSLDLTGSGEAREVLGGVQPLATVQDGLGSRRIYCATYDRGLWRSEDFGDTWSALGMPQNFFTPPVRADSLPTQITALLLEPEPAEDGQHALWVGTEPSRLYRSTDGGHSFELVNALNLPSRKKWSFPPRPESHHVQWITRSTGKALHLAIEAGAVLRSIDGGAHFYDPVANTPLLATVKSPVDAHVLLTHPLAPGRLYAALGDALMRKGRSYAESHDNGDTWHFLSAGLESNPYLYGMAINPADPHDIRVSAADGIGGAHRHGGSTIYRRDGDRWIEDSEGFPRDKSLIATLATHAGQPGRWFALSNCGVFVQEPRRAVWQRLAALPQWEKEHPVSLLAFDC